MCFRLPSLNILRPEDQCVEFKAPKKGVFVCFSSCRGPTVLWLDCHVRAQYQGDGQAGEQEIICAYPVTTNVCCVGT